MTETEATCGCSDYSSSRRRFLAGLTAAAGTGIVTSVLGDTVRQVAFGAPAGSNVLIVLSLRGGADGMSLVVPYGDPGYYQARPTIGVPTSTLLAKGTMFGLHPGFRPLLPMWKDGRFGAVHAVGLPQPNRSHFSSMEEIEDADPGSSQRSGWINRMIGLNHSTDPAEAVEMGSTMVPTSLFGRAPVLGLRDLTDLKLAGTTDRAHTRAFHRSLHRVWDRAPGALGQGARGALRTTEHYGQLATAPVRPRNGAAYPPGDLAATLKDTATLIRAGVGTRVVTIDYGTWDMHTSVGTLTWGKMRDMVKELAECLAAFFTDLGPTGNRVTMVTLSEFGRRLQQNGDAGLDHGYGNCVLLLGAGVKGGQVHGRWPHLSSGSLVDGDLAVTTDYRSVLTEVVQSRFPGTRISTVFPGFKPEKIGSMV
ncbi:MAG: DUF1501 domain-containing protein [Nocardioidaceae bacterium]